MNAILTSIGNKIARVPSDKLSLREVRH